MSIRNTRVVWEDPVLVAMWGLYIHCFCGFYPYLFCTCFSSHHRYYIIFSNVNKLPFSSISVNSHYLEIEYLNWNNHTKLSHWSSSPILECQTYLKHSHSFICKRTGHLVGKIVISFVSITAIHHNNLALQIICVFSCTTYILSHQQWEIPSSFKGY